MEKDKKTDKDTTYTRSSKPSPQKTLREVIMEARQANSREDLPAAEMPCLQDPYLRTSEFQNVCRKETAYCFVPSTSHFSPWDPFYPERPERSTKVNESIMGVYSRLKKITENHMVIINDLEMLTLVHSVSHIENVREMCEDAEEETAQEYDAIFFNGEDSYFNAVEAAKMTVTMAKLVARGKVQNGFANVRPPGHHATRCVPNGYCFFNNIAIAAKYLLKEHLADRILIIDYDVHHGQGTQRIFYDTDKVLYFSIHRYEFGTFWPNLEESSFDYIGTGEGKGFNINVPLNQTGMTDYDYLTIVTNILLPVAYEYKPTIILVSGGYDACMGCPEGRMNVTPAFYAHLITMLGGLARGKILVVLEGGYFLPSLGEAAYKTVQALLNDTCPPLEYHKTINSSVIDSINNVKVALRPYWKCFKQIEPITSVQDILRYDRYNNHVAVKKYFGVVDTAPFPTRGCYPENCPMKSAMFTAKLDFLKASYVNGETRVGYMANSESAFHVPPPDQRAQEVQARLTEIMNKLSQYDLIGDMQPVQFDTHLYTEGNCYPGIWNDVGEAIMNTHAKPYIDQLKGTGVEQKPDLYWTERSKMVCQYSCCNLCQLAREIKRGTISHGVGIVRPPGHHAKHAEGGGFCLINNVVVTANYALTRLRLNRVLILDFDIHHGDGTQQLTYGRKDIMYISMHRFDDGKFFPKDPSGNFSYVGEGGAVGYNLNIPFNNAKMGNADYLFTWMKVVLPMSYTFNPDLILVSAGFDAGINDPLGRYNIDPEIFGHFVQLVKPLAPVILALEGGYNLQTTAYGMVNCIRALLGYPLPMPDLGDVTKEAATAMNNAISVMKPYWPIMEVNKYLDPTIRTQGELDEAIKEADSVEINL